MRRTNDRLKIPRLLRSSPHIFHAPRKLEWHVLKWQCRHLAGRPGTANCMILEVASNPRHSRYATLLTEVLLLWLVCCISPGWAGETRLSGLASWYGEEHRGKLMANGRPFDPDRMTGASWYYPFGTLIRVTAVDPSLPSSARKSVLVRITDRGPSKKYVDSGRIIDLSRAAFNALASPDLGLIQVQLEIVPEK